jgi:hypothetical protein
MRKIPENNFLVNLDSLDEMSEEMDARYIGELAERVEAAQYDIDYFKEEETPTLIKEENLKTMRCPYCKQDTVSEVEYEETVMFLDVPIHYVGTKLHCSNPECPEPNRFSATQLQELSRQRREQREKLGRGDLIERLNKQRRRKS